MVYYARKISLDDIKGIKELRIALRITAKELGNIIGVSTQYVYKLEKNTGDIKIKYIQALSNKIGITEEILYKIITRA